MHSVLGPQGEGWHGLPGSWRFLLNLETRTAVWSASQWAAMNCWHRTWKYAFSPRCPHLSYDINSFWNLYCILMMEELSSEDIKAHGSYRETWGEEDQWDARNYGQHDDVDRLPAIATLSSAGVWAWLISLHCTMEKLGTLVWSSFQAILKHF